tara:strand:- start:302 stop:583 length:282 start_codon:yes stop_codon:yes gene_type:complete
MKTFEQYHNENPHIYTAFKHYALIAKQKGFKNYSAKSLFEIIRWHTPIRGEVEYFKINNNYAPDYARKMMKDYESFKGFFRVRELKAKRHETI